MDLASLFFQASLNPFLFRRVIRWYLYKTNDNNPKKVYNVALQYLERLEPKFRKISEKFDGGEKLHVRWGKYELKNPYGPAAGFSKNFEAVGTLLHVFGKVTGGTVVVSQREGNKPPTITVDKKNENIFNAESLPSEGVFGSVYNLSKLDENRSAPIMASFCGLPKEDKNKNLEKALQENEILIEKLNPYVDGFEFNVFCPNEASLAKMRTPEYFKQVLDQLKGYAPDKMKFVKLGPYETDEREDWMKLVEAWHDNGGDGVTLINTKKVPCPSLPYGYAGWSGRGLKEYRRRAVREVHERFPNLLIDATGGISDGTDSGETFELGATYQSGYAPFVFYGLGLIRKLNEELKDWLHINHYESLQDLFETRDARLKHR